MTKTTDAVSRTALLGACLGCGCTFLWALLSVLFSQAERTMAAFVPAWTELVAIFTPASILFGAVLLVRMRQTSSSRFSASAAAALAPIAAFTLAAVIVILLPRQSGSYAAEQGLRASVLVVFPIYGLTASPVWILGTNLLYGFVPRLDARSDTDFEE